MLPQWTWKLQPFEYNQSVYRLPQYYNALIWYVQPSFPPPWLQLFKKGVDSSVNGNLEGLAEAAVTDVITFETPDHQCGLHTWCEACPSGHTVLYHAPEHLLQQTWAWYADLAWAWLNNTACYTNVPDFVVDYTVLGSMSKSIAWNFSLNPEHHINMTILPRKERNSSAFWHSRIIFVCEML